MPPKSTEDVYWTSQEEKHRKDSKNIYWSLRHLYNFKFMKAEGNKKVSLGFDHQAKRYPCFKDVSKLWHFDYQAEEAKRFSNQPPELMWDPTVLSQD
jgi:hypothetical protein